MRRGQSFVASEANFTKCVGVSLFLWFIVVIVFVSRNGGNTSNYNLPFTMNNIPKDQKPQSLSYAQSLSAELTETGWKNIYIHNRNVRMSVISISLYQH